MTIRLLFILIAFLWIIPQTGAQDIIQDITRLQSLLPDKKPSIDGRSSSPAIQLDTLLAILAIYAEPTAGDAQKIHDPQDIVSFISRESLHLSAADTR